MKKTTAVVAMMLMAFTSFAQDITGQWNGLLKVQGVQLRVVFNVSKSADGYTSTMDSPDQGANGIPVTKTSFENPNIHFEVANAGIVYDGVLKENEIEGTFKQGGQSFPMNLSKKAIEKPIVKRPQEPTQPYPYYTEDVSFNNSAANITLAGTLTLPAKEGNYPAVIMITGSGPQNRNEELLGHKPFLIIADYLTRHGIAVLRYDDRGTAKSTGNFKTATSADFATDVKAAVAYLKTRKEINTKKIGLVGHSEGGLIAPMVAADSKDVAFIVLLAGPGMQGAPLLILQEALISKASGASDADVEKNKVTSKKVFDLIANTPDLNQMKTGITDIMNDAIKNDTSMHLPAGVKQEEFVSKQVEQLTSPWMLYFLQYDPVPTLQKVKCPVLAINGEKDLQVPPKENLSAIKAALEKGGNKKATIKELPGLNHLFQECKTGSPSEYAEIEQTFSPAALDEIAKWIQLQVK